MVKKIINRSIALSKLSELEKKFKQELAKTFLEYLEMLSLRKRIQEMAAILYETEVKRIVTLDQRLSKQEKKCLLLAYKGKGTHETSKILNRSINTVETHRKNLLKKLQVKDMPQAVGIGIKLINEIHRKR